MSIEQYFEGLKELLRENIPADYKRDIKLLVGA